MRRMTLTGWFALIALTAAGATAATPKEAIGFMGTVTGVVKSARPDGTSFVLTVGKAEPDEKTSAIKDGGPMAGKEITLGVRMPRDKDGKPHPSDEDVTYVKSLKPKASITVKVFAVRSDPSVLRITGPGEPATKPSPAK
jgi:hypothetical protein